MSLPKSPANRYSSPTSTPSVFVAIRSLKHQQSLIQSAQNRLKVLSRKISRVQIRRNNNQIKTNFHLSVQQSISQQKQIKKQQQLKQLAAINHRHSLNMQLRQKNRQMIASVRRSFHNANNMVYQQMIKNRQSNQKIIVSARENLMLSRVSNRQKLSRQQKSRQNSIRSFYEQKKKEQLGRKREEYDMLMGKKEERSRYLGVLVGRGSRIKLGLQRKGSEDGSNPEIGLITAV